jgi:DNA-binding response OmpR family regulator
MRLLLAEDEEELSKALVSVLQKNNYSVDAVYNGQDAVDYVDAGNYDGAIFDIMMPIKDGLEALKELRAKGVEIPILMLTARSEVHDKVEGLDLGADDYLTKPFAIPELLARLRTMTRRKSEGRSENYITMGNVKLDVMNSELVTDSGKEFLGHKEFQMMELFMSNTDQFVNADRLFERIWGFDSDVDMSVVWVNISNLRKKLRKLDADIKVKAERSIGYRLVKIE